VRAGAPGEEALLGAPELALGDDRPEPGFASAPNGNGASHDPLDGVQIHGRTRRPARPRIHPKAVIATGLAAFAIGAAVLTLPELIFGGSVASGRSTTYFGGGRPAAQQKKTQTAPKATTPTQTTTAPAQSAPATTTPTQTTTGTTPTTTAPSGGAPAPPVQTGTDTSPVPTTTTP
jgi:hypothetical protein